MNPVDYYNKLKTTEARKAYADRAGCSLVYFQQNLFSGTGIKKLPRPNLLIGLSSGSEGNVSLDEAIDYFLVQPVKSLAKEMEAKEKTPKTPAAPMTTKRTNAQQMELVG